MPPKLKLTPKAGVTQSRIRHTVAFYETDAMGIVHHSNYVRFLELARITFLNEHDRAYTEYIAEGFHVPVTRVEMSYQRACRFADVIEVTCWLAWARQASIGFHYRLEVQGQLVACGTSDHAITDAQGRPVRIPEGMRAKLAGWLGTAPS